MHTERKLRSTVITAAILSFVLFSLLMNVFDPLVHVYAGSFKSPSNLTIHPTMSRDEIIARAKAWVEVPVPYDEYGWYQGYREDCSGYVSMAWQLSESLSTYTLPTVSHQINKDELLPGDILLNQWGGWIKYGSPDAHVVIFDSWVDSSHTHYNAYEESPYYGKANYTTNMPYPYWPGYDSSDYVPMRLNSLSNTPVPTPSSITTPSIPVPVPTPTQTQTPTLNFTPFVGTWHAHARYLIFNANGTAIYQGRVFVSCSDGYTPPCDIPPEGGMNTTIIFTNIVGQTAYGSITAGTGDRNFTTNARMPIGTQIRITLENDDLLQVSDGWLLCGPNVPPSDPYYANGCNSNA